MADTGTSQKKNYKLLWQGVSLLGMLLAPALLMYPGAQGGKTGLVAAGYAVLVFCMLIPLFLKK